MEGQYTANRRISRLGDSLTALRDLVTAGVVVLGLSYATKGFFTGYTSLSRPVVLGSMALLLVLLIIARAIARNYQTNLIADGYALRKVLLVGEGQAARDFLEFLHKRPWLGVVCAGTLCTGDECQPLGQTTTGILAPLVGTVGEVHRALFEHRADEVIVALDPGEIAAMPHVTESLFRAQVPFRLVPSVFEESFRTAQLVGFEELPVINVEVDPLTRAQRGAKRAMDVILSAVALLLASPVLLLIALAVKLDSPGPVFFRQERVGRNGRHFQMLKFRTMVVDAEQRLKELEDKNEAQGPLFKIERDPRITRVGRFLRQWSLDEVPQFINVLRGDMSIVGPRPPLPREVDLYESPHYVRLRATPGISGLWQVSGRSKLTFEEMVKLDRYYLDNWSIGLDLSIMLKTVWVVLRRRGAY